MRIWKHPLFWMTVNALAMLYTVNIDKLIHISELTYNSIQKVIFPILVITFILFMICGILEIKTMLTKEVRE